MREKQLWNACTSFVNSFIEHKKTYVKFHEKTAEYTLKSAKRRIKLWTALKAAQCNTEITWKSEKKSCNIIKTSTKNTVIKSVNMLNKHTDRTVRREVISWWWAFDRLDISTLLFNCGGAGVAESMMSTLHKRNVWITLVYKTAVGWSICGIISQPVVHSFLVSVAFVKRFQTLT